MPGVRARSAKHTHVQQPHTHPEATPKHRLLAPPAGRAHPDHPCVAEKSFEAGAGHRANTCSLEGGCPPTPSAASRRGWPPATLQWRTAPCTEAHLPAFPHGRWAWRSAACRFVLDVLEEGQRCEVCDKHVRLARAGCSSTPPRPSIPRRQLATCCFCYPRSDLKVECCLTQSCRPQCPG